jgi:rubredoxin
MNAKQIVTVLLELEHPIARCPVCSGNSMHEIMGLEHGWRCNICGHEFQWPPPEHPPLAGEKTKSKIPPKAMMMAVTGGSDLPIAGGGQG